MEINLTEYENMRKVSQVAVEAIANAAAEMGNGHGYEPETIDVVREMGKKFGVAQFYLDMLPVTTNQIAELLAPMGWEKGDRPDMPECTCGIPTGNTHETDCDYIQWIHLYN